MSASADEISNPVNGIDADDDDDDDDEEEDATAVGNKLHRRRRRGFGKAKEVAMYPFTKAKKQLRTIRSRRALLRSSSSSGKVIVNGSGSSGCKLCFSRPRVLEPSDGSPTISDPNDPNFTNAMFRALIEKNDFYCKECNPHL